MFVCCLYPILTISITNTIFLAAYALQDSGMDTVDANVHLGFDADERDYSMVQPILKYFGVSAVEILTNNPTKIEALESLGIVVVKR